MKIKRIWDTSGRSAKPEFRVSGLSLDHIQFSFRNVTGAGAKTRLGAINNWVRQVRIELCRK